MLTSFVRKVRARVANLPLVARVVIAALRDRAITIDNAYRGGPSAHLTPRGRFLMAISGADDGEPAKPEPEPEPAKPEPEKMVSQADVDRIVQERLAREKAKFADYDTLKEKAAKFDEAETANQTALEKAQADAVKQKDAADEAARKLSEAQTKAQEDRRQSLIETEAIKAGANDPSDVHALLLARGFKVTTKKDDKDTELSVTIGDDGQVAGVEETVKAFLAEKPHLVGNTPPPPGDGGARNPVPPKDRQAAIKEAEGKGDFRTAMALKQQQLVEMQEQQQPKPAGGGQ